MRVVYFGTPETSIPPLQKLLDHAYEVCAVFTQPDRPAGRGQKARPSPIKLFAQERRIPVYQPEKVRTAENAQILKHLHPDFLVTAAYGQILPGEILSAAKIAPLNVHFSLLPRYRGAAPVAHAILNGDASTGVTIMIMEEGLDSGPVLMKREVEISRTSTTGELETELAAAGAGLLVETMEKYVHRAIRPVPQDETLVSWAPRISKDDARIFWSEPAQKIHDRIRAMNPSPGAYTLFRGEKLRLWKSIPGSEDAGSGGILPGTCLGLSENGLRVQCASGSVLEILELQKPSKNRVSGREFAAGSRLHPNEPLFENE